jgi:uncharacterized protein
MRPPLAPHRAGMPWGMAVFLMAGITLAGITLAGPAWAQSFLSPPPAPSTAVPDHAYAAYQTGFYERAFTEATARVARDNGDAAAMTLLGELFRQGLGLKLDLKKAAEWYRLAHERGDSNATFALAMATLNGDGVPRDPEAARRLLEAAAPRQPQAAYNLALIHLADQDATSRAKAIALLERAAAAEIPDAQHALAVLKRKGQDTPVDLSGAAELMRRAAQNGSEAGEIEYAIILFNGQGVPKDETRAADRFQRLALRGNAIAQNRYARLFAAGRGRPKDAVFASAWNILAKQQGLVDESLDRLFDNLPPDDKTRALALASKLSPSSLTAEPVAGQ